MDLEGRDYMTATGIGMELDTHTRTPYAEEWQRLLNEVRRKKEAKITSKKNKKKTKTAEESTLLLQTCLRIAVIVLTKLLFSSSKTNEQVTLLRNALMKTGLIRQ